jgi:hypothetical protein
MKKSKPAANQETPRSHHLGETEMSEIGKERFCRQRSSLRVRVPSPAPSVGFFCVCYSIFVVNVCILFKLFWAFEVVYY